MRIPKSIQKNKYYFADAFSELYPIFRRTFISPLFFQQNQRVREGYLGFSADLLGRWIDFGDPS